MICKVTYAYGHSPPLCTMKDGFRVSWLTSFQCAHRQALRGGQGLHSGVTPTLLSCHTTWLTHGIGQHYTG